MQVALINIFDRAVGKNILTKPFLSTVRLAGIRVLALVPEGKLEEYQDWLSHLGVEVVSRPRVTQGWLETAALFTARNSIPAHTVRQIQEEGFEGRGRMPIHKYIPARTLWILSHSYFFRAVLKLILPLAFKARSFEALLGKIKPDLVFATTMYAPDDVRLMYAARARGIPLVGMVKSWDNLTSKDNMLVPPDLLIVNNKIVMQEAITLHHYHAARISVVGVSQFDTYVDGVAEPREKFFARMRLDPHKKLILYSAMGSWLVRYEREMIQLLAGIVAGGELHLPAQLLVRLHPAYTSEDEVLGEIPGVVLDRPGHSHFAESNPWKADWKFTDDDVAHLTSTLRYSDVTLNSGSTMILDALCFDKPIIGIAFDAGHPYEPYWRSARRLFKREHCEKLLPMGGMQIVENKEQLVGALNRYLQDPSLDRDGRQNMVEAECHKLDGKAGERIAEVLIGSVKQGYEKAKK